MDTSGASLAEPAPPAADSWAPGAPQGAPAPEERPGLGTEWGETRESHVHDVIFFRAEADRPSAVAQVFYNDRAGVDAMATYRGEGSPRSIDVSTGNGTISVYLVDRDWDMPLDPVRVGGRTYVVGQEGHRYSILIANRTRYRYEAVATVDGLDVLSGQPGRYDRRGYLVSPWANLEIEGFRRSEDEVAAFRFSKVGDSYAAQRGDARNVGVIGVAFFAERRRDWTPEELRTRDTARPFPDQGRFAPPPG